MDGQTDNQQRKIGESDLDWLAGLWDGEGTFGLYYAKARHTQMKPHGSVVNTHKGALDRVTQTLTAFGIGHHVMWQQIYQREGLKSERPTWRVAVLGLKRLRPLLELMIPRLTVKQEQAKTLLEFIDYRMAKPHKAPYGEDELKFLARMRQLNSPNRSTTERQPGAIVA